MRKLVWVCGAPTADAEELATQALLGSPETVVRLAELPGFSGPRPREAVERRLKQLAAEPGHVVVVGPLARSGPHGLEPLVSAELFHLLKPAGLVVLEFGFRPRAEREMHGELEVVRRDSKQVRELRSMRAEQELVRAYAAALCAASGSSLKRLSLDRGNVKAGISLLEELLAAWLSS